MAAILALPAPLACVLPVHPLHFVSHLPYHLHAFHSEAEDESALRAAAVAAADAVAAAANGSVMAAELGAWAAGQADEGRGRETRHHISSGTAAH